MRKKWSISANKGNCIIRTTIIKVAGAILRLLTDPVLMAKRECPTPEDVPSEVIKEGL
jgi:hypothetical protein